MRKLGVWGVAASLALGLAVQGVTAGDDPPISPLQQKGLLDIWFGSPPTPVKKKKTEAEQAAEAKAKAEQKRAELRQAYDDIVRRWAVCERLRALAPDDLELLKRVDALSDRAWALYYQKVPPERKHLSGGSFVADGFEADKTPPPREPSNRTASPRREKP